MLCMMMDEQKRLDIHYFSHQHIHSTFSYMCFVLLLLLPLSRFFFPDYTTISWTRLLALHCTDVIYLSHPFIFSHWYVCTVGFALASCSLASLA